MVAEVHGAGLSALFHIRCFPLRLVVKDRIAKIAKQSIQFFRRVLRIFLKSKFSVFFLEK